MLVWTWTACVLAYSGAVVLDQPVERVEVELGLGTVEVRPSDDAQTTVSLSFEGFGEAPLDPIVTDGSVLLRDPCVGAGLCEGHYVVRTPPDTDVEVRIEEGALWVSAMGGSVLADVGGRVEVVRHTGAQVDVRATSGQRLELSFDASPQLVSAASTEGPLVVLVPPGAYALDVEAGGPVTLDPEIEVNPESGSRLSLRSDANTVTVATN